jgi:hypothetical protein
MRDTTVYVVIMEGVYDHGCWGVYTSLEAAKARCAEVMGRSDGYHMFRIETIPLDTPVKGNGRLGEEHRQLILESSGGVWRWLRERVLNPLDPEVTTPEVEVEAVLRAVTEDTE